MKILFKKGLFIFLSALTSTIAFAGGTKCNHRFASAKNDLLKNTNPVAVRTTGVLNSGVQGTSLRQGVR